MLPRSRLLAVRILIETTALYPIERLIRLFLWQIQMSRRLVMESDPLSPLLPFVSSTELIESIWSSPECISSCDNCVSKRISRSCQTPSSLFLDFPLFMASMAGRSDPSRGNRVRFNCARNRPRALTEKSERFKVVPWKAPVTSQSSTMPPVRGHSREGPVVERLVAPCALCGCIHPLWFPRPTFVRIPVAGRKLPSPFHPRPSAKGRRRSALSIPWLCPGPRCPHARTASLRLAGCHVAASRSRHASAVTWPPTWPSALLFSSFLRAQAPCLRRRGLAPAGRSPCSSCSRPDARALLDRARRPG